MPAKSKSWRRFAVGQADVHEWHLTLLTPEDRVKREIKNDGRDWVSCRVVKRGKPGRVVICQPWSELAFYKTHHEAVKQLQSRLRQGVKLVGQEKHLLKQQLEHKMKVLRQLEGELRAALRKYGSR